MERWREETVAPINLDLDWLRQLVSLVEREDIAELIINQGSVHVVIRGRTYRPPVPMGAPTVNISLPPFIEEAPVAPPAPDASVDERLFHITAPLTGTFYSRPRPDAPPFVTVGAPVEEDQVVALVEAMKFFNEVKSEVKGIVREIAAKDGQLVKHGDTLIVVERWD